MSSALVSSFEIEGTDKKHLKPTVYERLKYFRFRTPKTLVQSINQSINQS
jgi:hypothetical protein